MSKHLCIKKEDGLYINGAKCTDGFIEGAEYEEGEHFKRCVRRFVSPKSKGVREYAKLVSIPLDDAAILLPALKEDSGEEEQQLFSAEDIKKAYVEGHIGRYDTDEEYLKSLTKKAK